MVAPKSHKTRGSASGRTMLILRVLGMAVFLGIVVRRPGGWSSFPTSFELYDAQIFQGDNATMTTLESVPSSPPLSPPIKTGRSSFTIVNENDLPPTAFWNQSEFTFEYFTTMPECTPLQPSDVSFTLVTQLSTDRLWIMKHQCQRWPSPLPIAIAIYLPPNAKRTRYEQVRHRLDVELACDLSRMHVTIFQAQSSLQDYPVNTLRNLALQSIHTTHAAYIDSDFLISQGLHDHLLTTTKVLANDTKAAVVIPAFNYIPNCPMKKQAEIRACLDSEWKGSSGIPKHHADIVALVDRKTRPRVDRGFQSRHGQNLYHGSTMYKTWLHNQSEVVSIPCIKSVTYEPYLALRICNEFPPKFPELFKGWGHNKITWIKILLRKLGYRLWQVPRGFVMHIPHELSVARTSDKDGHKAEFDPYLNWLLTVPLHPEALPLCVDWKKEHGNLQG